MLTQPRIFHSIHSILLCGALLLTCSPAEAAGFYIQEQSVSGLGKAFAGSAAKADDASTIFYNPAGMTQLSGWQFTGGVSTLLPKAELEDTGTIADLDGPGAGVVTAPIAALGATNDGGNPYDATPVPSMYVAGPLVEGRNDLWAGVGVSTPFGLANEYDENWFGRFDSTSTKLTVVNITTALAFKPVSWMSVGGGLDIAYADANLQSAVRAATEGHLRLTGDDWTTGYNAGVTITPTDGTTIGAHYRSAITHKLTGQFQITGTGSALVNADTTAKANLDLPDIATLSIAQDITPDTTLLGSATWFGWSNFESIAPTRGDGAAVTPIVQNYQNTWSFAVGVEHTLTDDWLLRAGYQFDETPTNDEFRTSRTPDGDRQWFSVGAGYAASDKITIDAAATYIDIADEEISVTRNVIAAGVPSVQMEADTSGSVGIVALGVNYKF